MDPETSLASLPPPQSLPVSPSLGSRKRSIHEVDSAAMPPPSPKRPVTSDPSENQENRDPSVPSLNKDNASPQSRQLVSVEVPVQGCAQASMSQSVQQTSTIDMSSISSQPQHLGPGTAVYNDVSGTPTAKKRKLSPASQQAKQQEKEVKERERVQEKQRKEEEKRLKEEEKKKREAAREEEKRLKEEERKKREAEREEKRRAKEEGKAAKEAAKEEEKRRKEEEKLKKERAQPKLNSFFAKPQLPSAPGVASSYSPSKTATNLDTSAEPSKSTQSDYEKAFPEFFLQSHTTVAPSHRFERDSEALRHVCESIDSFLPPNDGSVHQHLPFRPSEVFHMIPFTRRRGRQTRSVKEILRNIQTASDVSQPGVNPETNSANPLKQLQNITMKSFKFGEDVRPPYQGTFTRAVPESSAKKLCRNPYYRGLPDVNYDYDSEAEWEEPEEGEDLDSEEEEESDDGEDDMDGFLDDEDDALAGGKRRLIVGDLEPVCSGIQWAIDGVDAEMQTYQIQTISDAVKFPIDPFSGVYWQKPRAEPTSAKGRALPSFSNQTLDSFRAKSNSDGPSVGSALPPASTKAKRPFPPELLPEFKEAVEGSDLSKIGLVEILKKKFPKVSKDTLKVTLDEVAVRVGQKEVEKKWVCR